jgi:hypothetical protein
VGLIARGLIFADDLERGIGVEGHGRWIVGRAAALCGAAGGGYHTLYGD